jgi:hypothetical protein
MHTDDITTESVSIGIPPKERDTTNSKDTILKISQVLSLIITFCTAVYIEDKDEPDNYAPALVILIASILAPYFMQYLYGFKEYKQNILNGVIIELNNIEHTLAQLSTGDPDKKIIAMMALLRILDNRRNKQNTTRLYENDHQLSPYKCIALITTAMEESAQVVVHPSDKDKLKSAIMTEIQRRFQARAMTHDANIRDEGEDEDEDESKEQPTPPQQALKEDEDAINSQTYELQKEAGTLADTGLHQIRDLLNASAMIPKHWVRPASRINGSDCKSKQLGVIAENKELLFFMLAAITGLQTNTPLLLPAGVTGFFASLLSPLRSEKAKMVDVLRLLARGPYSDHISYEAREAIPYIVGHMQNNGNGDPGHDTHNDSTGDQGREIAVLDTRNVLLLLPPSDQRLAALREEVDAELLPIEEELKQTVELVLVADRDKQTEAIQEHQESLIIINNNLLSAKQQLLSVDKGLQSIRRVCAPGYPKSCAWTKSGELWKKLNTAKEHINSANTIIDGTKAKQLRPGV